MAIVIFIVAYLLIAIFGDKFIFSKFNAIEGRANRIAKKSFAVSLLFSPSLVAVYIVALPAPFPIGVLFYAHKALQDLDTTPLVQMLYLCIVPFIVFWLLCFVIGIVGSFFRRKPVPSEKMHDNV